MSWLELQTSKSPLFRCSHNSDFQYLDPQCNFGNFFADETGNPGRNGNDDDIDGKSLSGEEDVDGVPLDGAALLKSAIKGNPKPPVPV